MLRTSKYANTSACFGAISPLCLTLVMATLMTHSSSAQTISQVTVVQPKGVTPVPIKPSSLSANVKALPVPATAEDELKAASKVNGVEIASAPPWHAKVSYDQFDEDGDNVHSGTFEEFYVGPKKYRKVYVGDAINQVEIANDSGLYRTGDQRWLTAPELQITDEILNPFIDAFNLPDRRPDKMEMKVGPTDLDCVVLRNTRIKISDYGLVKYCFEPKTMALRYKRGNGWDETTYNDLLEFQGSVVARSVQVTHAGKPFLKIHLDLLEPIAQDDESYFTSPNEAKPISGRIQLSYQILQKNLIGRLNYPNMHGIKGKVAIRFIVGKEGNVVDAAVASGSTELGKQVIGFVRQLHFRPYLVNGEPVEVESGLGFEAK